MGGNKWHQREDHKKCSAHNTKGCEKTTYTTTSVSLMDNYVQMEGKGENRDA
jgi:hypothetical protein